jgi:hypothetical protein
MVPATQQLSARVPYRAFHSVRSALAAQSRLFKGRNIGLREFGRTIVFYDPSGHQFCLGELSRESLRLSSSRKIQQIAAGCDMALPISAAARSEWINL